jgi:hypothetical protein
MPKRYADEDAYGVSEALEYDTRRAGAGIAALSWVIAVLWLGAAAAFVYLYVGMPAVQAMRPEMLAGLSIFAVLPAFLILFAGAAAREGARARAQSHVLSAAAEKMLSPAPSAEAAARHLSSAVRSEIASLEAAIDRAMAKAREVEVLVTRQSEAVDGASYAASNSARQVLEGMERERAALLQIAGDLNSQASMIGNSISRHAASISETARAAQNDIRIADGELNARMASFGAATAKIGERTGSLNKAAQLSAESAHRLENILGGALEALTKATSLTDAARQSAEAATSAANNTAGAVRDTTLRAVEDARRAAEVIRGESAAVERDAAIALARLHEAAEAARTAAQSVREISSEVAAETPRRIAPISAPVEPESASPFFFERRDTPRADEAPRMTPASPQDQQRIAASSAGRPVVTIAPRPPNDPGTGPAWTWRDVLASVDEGPAAPLDRRRPAGASASAAPAASAAVAVNARARHPLAVVNMIDAAGLQLPEVFDTYALDRIAQRARNGVQARRRAVRDAASDAVSRLTTLLEQDPDSRAAAAEFLRSEGPRLSELLGRGRASMGADATRAFLLVDAASG